MKSMRYVLLILLPICIGVKTDNVQIKKEISIANGDIRVSPRINVNRKRGVVIIEISVPLEYSDDYGDQVPIALTCPYECKCPDTDMVDCSEAGLEQIPQIISNQTISLLLNGNRLTKVTEQCFSNCPKLYSLNLENNFITDQGLAQLAFYQLAYLSNLQLSNNNLTFIPSRLPISLTSLHISDNKLRTEKVHKSAFSKLNQLEELHLSGNLLSEIPRLPNSVQLVYLNNNKLDKIDGTRFRGKRDLRGLYLQRNNLTDEKFENTSLRYLSGLEVLHLGENKLTRIPKNIPQKIKILYVGNNNMDMLSTEQLGQLKKLEYFVVNGNKLNSSGIENGSLSRLKKLRVLHIFKNDLSKIPKLPNSIETVIFQSNKIIKIEKGVFRSAINLKHLNLRYNDLKNSDISKGAFRPLPKINTVDLMGNKLTAVPSLPKKVRFAFLGENAIVRIPPKSINKLIHLRHLALNQNKLQDEGIPPSVFRENYSMKVLDLSSNMLKRIPKYLPPNVEYIHLQNNMIDVVEPDAFALSPLLKGIYLKNNMLVPETTPLIAFRSLRFLSIVDVTWRKTCKTMEEDMTKSLLVKDVAA